MSFLSMRLYKLKVVSLMRRWSWYCRCRTVIALVCISLLLTLVASYYIYNKISNVTSCSDSDSKLYLQQLCSNYSRGLISGSVCPQLCDTNEIQFEKCLGHGIKLHVLRAKWNGNTIVLKTPKGLTRRSSNRLEVLTSKTLTKDFTLSREEFLKYANRSIFHNIAGGTHHDHTTQVLNKIFSECDVAQNGVLRLTESLSCWELIQSDEYMLYMLLSDLSAVPKVYGTCGDIYAVEYADAEPFMEYKTSWSETRSWTFRAELALAVMDLIEEFEETPYGTLYLCDIQEANLGIVKKSKDGAGLVAKAIDLDISMFKNTILSQLERRIMFSGGICSQDSDCNFNFKCLGECDMETGTCTGKLKSSNLSIICRFLFKKLYPLHPNLLSNPPAAIARQLSELLEQCSYQDLSHIDWSLFDQLKSVLLNSIE